MQNVIEEYLHVYLLVCVCDIDLNYVHLPFPPANTDNLNSICT